MLIFPHKHRRPPKPPWMKEEKQGQCRWCQEKIYPQQRKNPKSCLWHLECLYEYKIFFDWNFTRHEIFSIKNGICDGCRNNLIVSENENKHACSFTKINNNQVIAKKFEVDHIIPLVLWEPRDLATLTQDNFLDWYAPWSIGNLQLLCPQCHKDKTKKDLEIHRNRR